MDPLRLTVDSLDQEARRIVCEEKPEAFEILGEMSRAGECEFTAPLAIRLEAARLRQVIAVTGEIDTRVRLTCSRCLSEFQTGLTTRFAITFVEAAALPDGDSDNAGEELCEEDLTCITFSGESIDLRPAVQEQIVMAFPLRALCRESCKGLCVKCGKDLNSGSCDCRHTIPDNRFAVLKGLKIPG